MLLGAYLGIEPRAVSLAYGPQGKPSLATPDRTMLGFNIAHSGDYAVMVFARSAALGVDIEHVRPLHHIHRLARTALSPQEYAAWSALGPGDQQEAFFACWTRKEAFVKAMGCGLTYPLKELDVCDVYSAPTASALQERGAPALIQGVRWHSLCLPPLPGFATALVASTPLAHIQCFRLVG